MDEYNLSMQEFGNKSCHGNGVQRWRKEMCTRDSGLLERARLDMDLLFSNSFAPRLPVAGSVIWEFYRERAQCSGVLFESNGTELESNENRAELGHCGGNTNKTKDGMRWKVRETTQHRMKRIFGASECEHSKGRYCLISTHFAHTMERITAQNDANVLLSFITLTYHNKYAQRLDLFCSLNGGRPAKIS